MATTETHRGDPPSGPSQEQIAKRARELWMERGSPGGRDLEHWLDAERELRRQSTKPPAAPASNRSEARSKSDWVEAEKRLDGLVEEKPTPARRTPKGEQL